MCICLWEPCKRGEAKGNRRWTAPLGEVKPKNPPPPLIRISEMDPGRFCFPKQSITLSKLILLGHPWRRIQPAQANFYLGCLLCPLVWHQLGEEFCRYFTGFFPVIPVQSVDKQNPRTQWQAAVER